MNIWIFSLYYNNYMYILTPARHLWLEFFSGKTVWEEDYVNKVNCLM